MSSGLLSATQCGLDTRAQNWFSKGDFKARTGVLVPWESQQSGLSLLPISGYSAARGRAQSCLTWVQNGAPNSPTSRGSVSMEEVGSVQDPPGAGSGRAGRASGKREGQTKTADREGEEGFWWGPLQGQAAEAGTGGLLCGERRAGKAGAADGASTPRGLPLPAGVCAPSRLRGTSGRPSLHTHCL